MPSRPANRNVRLPDVPPPPEAPDDPGSRTLRRGLQVLDAVLAQGRDGARVVDLCRAAGLERATVYRLLATLLESGYVAQRGRFRYVAGPRLAAMAEPAGQPNMAMRLAPVLERVSRACGDAAFAIVREGPTSHCIARHVGTHPVQILVIQVGTRQPLGVGAAGLALLAALPDAEMQAAIAANAQALPRYGGMTPERLAILVRATRERGWSVVGNHATQGVLAAGMAVRNAAGEPVAAISVASTVDRMPRERQQLIARWMREALAALLPGGV
ncbi:helix-turn-helix domain-containing protein [Acidovorax sp. sif1233]|uniref:IclR family transcriptional regulator n=1 Tax=unclassified Acidovorax TaxID=2684926 RepID=UPI001C448D5B|nr:MULTISPECIES: IclR family transcriptional regulator C-terminal domain-containing protein [unclassified Acidovorax]MBV7430584.1 helix-turn-helix domain-containing protein [Acidovorax sp. sif0732]MBV7449008.1 helix-turn-helix domain-containing protein [Acidovorax sp. sif0715]MBV7456964.1 helix-turn-helix domain-containing protein [Acidovorax sp. sif1233]